MDIIRPELDPGESVIWASMAGGLQQGMALSGPQTLFAIPFLLFSLFWTFMATGGFSMDEGFGLFGMLWGGMFVLVGAGMFLFGLRNFFRGFRTAYAVTENRILIISDLMGRRIHSISAGNVGQIQRSGGQRGSLRFPGHQPNGWTARGYPLSSSLGFYGIRDPKSVEAMIRRFLMDS